MSNKFNVWLENFLPSFLVLAIYFAFMALLLVSCATTPKSYTYKEVVQKYADNALECASDLEMQEFRPVLHVIQRTASNQEATTHAIEWYLSDCAVSRMMQDLKKGK